MEVTERFADVVRRDPVPLDEAALLIGMHAAPGRDPETSLARLDDLAGSVPQPSVETLLATLFGAEGFVGDSESYYDPRNSYLHEVLERRRGIPITLSVVAMEVGRRIGVALDGVGTPAHFMLRTREPEPRFVDAFGGGRILDRREMDVFFDALAPGRSNKPVSRRLEYVCWRSLLALPPVELACRPILAAQTEGDASRKGGSD